MKARWIIGVFLAVVWPALEAVPVYADGGDASKIHACVRTDRGREHDNDSDGRVRIVGPNDTCRNRREFAVHWSITGPQGLKGDKGDTGAQGPAGTLASFDELDGLSCTRNGQAGTVDVSYSAGGAVLRCVTATRFIDNGDGTITDTQTGLQWEKKTDDGSVHDKDNIYRWSNTGTAPDGTAFTDFLATLNSNCLGTSGDGSTVTAGFAGHCDWRLPTIAELRSILLAPSPCGTSPCINPIFGPTAASLYWSSTTHASLPSFAWDVFFSDGLVVINGKFSINPVRAVRGGS